MRHNSDKACKWKDTRDDTNKKQGFLMKDRSDLVKKRPFSHSRIIKKA